MYIKLHIENMKLQCIHTHIQLYTAVFSYVKGIDRWWGGRRKREEIRNGTNPVDSELYMEVNYVTAYLGA